MGQTTDKIETFIESTREELGSNLQELEQKVKSATDWRQQFQKNPLTMIGVAVGGGVLLATMLPGRSKMRRDKGYYNRAADLVGRVGSHRQKHYGLETLDSIKGALMGVAATRLTDFVGKFVPGFHDQLQRLKEKVN